MWANGRPLVYLVVCLDVFAIHLLEPTRTQSASLIKTSTTLSNSHTKETILLLAKIIMMYTNNEAVDCILF